MTDENNLSPAEAFDRFFGPAVLSPGAQLLLDLAKPKPGEHVLDHACGTGTAARLAASFVGENGKVIGLDVNPGMLAVARSRPAPSNAPIEWREGDANALDFPDESFDLILCQQGLQYFPDRAAAVREMRRVLKKGGRLALNLWQALESHEVYAALSEAQAGHLGVPLSHVTAPWSFPDAKELKNSLIEAGFKDIEIVPKTFDAHFPSTERFVYLTLFASSAFLDEFDWENAALRSALIADVSRAIEPVIQKFRDGDGLTFPVSWNYCIAYKQPAV